MSDHPAERDEREWTLTPDLQHIVGNARRYPLRDGPILVVPKSALEAERTRAERAEREEAKLHNALLEIKCDWSDWSEPDALRRVLQIADDAMKGRPDYPLNEHENHSGA